MTLDNLAKPVFIASILVFSIAGLGIIIQDVSAEHGKDPGITKDVGIGSNTLDFRDITNLDLQTNVTTVDYSNTRNGIVTINLEELDANLDITAIDMVNATANSTTSGSAKAKVKLTETGINTGIFSGTLFLSTTETIDDTLQVSEGDSISVLHDAESDGVGRLQAELEMTVAGSIEITDFLINSGEDFGDIIPRSHGVNLKLLDGATIDPANPPVITLSFAHLDLGINAAADLSMYYDPGDVVELTLLDVGLLPFCGTSIPDCVVIDGLPYTVLTFAGGWEQIRDPVQSPISQAELNAMTITSDVANTNWGNAPCDCNQLFGPVDDSTGIPTEARFMLGFESSIGGGGGGGLVRPGFVVNALAGANVISSFFAKGGASGDFTGGSKDGPAKPFVTSGTVGTLSDESIGFVQQGVTSDSDSGSTSNSLGSTQNVGIGKDLTFKYNVYENKGPDSILHATMYFFDAQIMGADDRIKVANSETYIMFEKGKPVKVVDPYGYFEKASFELVPIDTFNAALKYDITFSKIMPESHIVLRTWDSDKYSTDTLYENAIVVSENSIADNDTSTDNEPLTQSEFEASPFLDTQYENQLTKEETTTKTGFPGIPLWVKNNAMWWHEKQIDDADFVAGIRYMINEEIITIPETTITSSTTEGIPQWVSDVAGFWSNDQIPDDQFVQAMQWLVSNGVMEV